MSPTDEILHPLHRHSWGGLLENAVDPEQADLVIVGLPYDGGVSYRRGAAEGPARVRMVSTLGSAATEDGLLLGDLKIADLGDLEPTEPTHAYFEDVASRLSKLPKESFLIGLGGDHSVSVPLHRSVAKRWGEPFGIVHIDAHPDLFEIYADDRLSHACPLRRAAELSHVGPERIVSLCIRSMCDVEVEYASRVGLRLITAKEMARRDLGDVVGEVAERLSGLSRIYLDIDIDALDPSVAPGTGYPEPGGLSSREFLTLIERLFDALPIRSMGLVEIAPPLDVNDLTSFVGMRTIFEVMGHLQRRKSA